ncbi:MAG: hypothetical protein HQM10_01185 [Candidatus Riflebacteria bacterium]|nr:hypothetical protein [Candidatus Riflebacteria bacterium]
MTLCKKSGFVLMLVLAITAVLLLLGITMHFFVSQQTVSLSILVNSEIAHFLAESGISFSSRSVREAIKNSSGGIRSLLEKPSNISDTCLTSTLKDTWNDDLTKFAAEIDPTASIKVDVWLRKFTQTETNSAQWVDPGAKTGFLVIESTGQYRGMQRKISVSRKVTVASCLPPVYCRFSLHAKDAGRDDPNRFNLLYNDYDGINSDPRPFVVYNHDLPDSSIEPKPMAQILSEEKDENIYKKRAWIYLGRSPLRLHLTSGPGRYGEIFHFYDVANPNTFQAVKFKKQQSQIPPVFGTPFPWYWDRPDLQPGQPVRTVNYLFDYSYIIAGFHDKSGTAQTNAMYLGGILNSEKSRFGSRSSILHLYGDAEKGRQSRAKVLGKVNLAFPRYAYIDIVPQESDVQQMFANTKNPPPTFLLPSLFQNEYDTPTKLMEDVKNRHFGGPLLPFNKFFQSYEQYKSCMSTIVEVPYITSYNSIQDIVAPSGPKVFPPSRELLKEDLSNTVKIEKGGQTIYEGPVNPPLFNETVNKRVQQQFETIDDFWKSCIDSSDNTLKLDRIVRIVNPRKDTLVVPPAAQGASLAVSGGGMIILEKGDILIKGVEMKNNYQALTIIAPEAVSVLFDNDKPCQVNIVAPKADFMASGKPDISGILAVNFLSLDSRFNGGALKYRESQNPEYDKYYSFYKAWIDEKDELWFE